LDHAPAATLGGGKVHLTYHADFGWRTIRLRRGGRVKDVWDYAPATVGATRYAGAP
jgi:hypothetical protein